MRFFAISKKRLFWGSFLSGGLYHYYWFYKNWKGVKTTEKRRINPISRSLFWFFFIFSLFRKIFRSARLNGYCPYWGEAFVLALFYMLAVFMLNVIDEPSWGGVAAFWSYYVMSLAVLLPVQRAINFNNLQIEGAAAVENRFSRAEKWWLGIGSILFVVIVFLQIFMLKVVYFHTT